MFANVVLYGKLRFCERGISAGNLEVTKELLVLNYAKYSNFLYKVLANAFFYFHFHNSFIFRVIFNLQQRISVISFFRAFSIPQT